MENPYQTPQPAEQTTAPDPMRHSRIGIASFICAVSGVLLVFSPMIVGPALEAAQPGLLDKEPSAASLVLLAVVAGLLAAIVAIGLGTAAFFQRNQKRVFPVLGIVLGIAVFGVLLIMAVLFQAHRARLLEDLDASNPVRALVVS